VVQNGASSACLNRLSLRARSQLGSPALSSGHPFAEVQSAPADSLQRQGLCPGLAQAGRLLDDLDRACLQDLHRPASDKQGVQSFPCVRSGDGPALQSYKVPIPLQEAHPGGWPLAEVLHWQWTSAFSSCAAAESAGGATGGAYPLWPDNTPPVAGQNSAAKLHVCLWGFLCSLGWSVTHGLLRRALLRAPPVLDVQAGRSVGACSFFNMPV
jgi:hypothetical protein